MKIRKVQKLNYANDMMRCNSTCDFAEYEYYLEGWYDCRPYAAEEKKEEDRIFKKNILLREVTREFLRNKRCR